jgi:hypothetical protein
MGRRLQYRDTRLAIWVSSQDSTSDGQYNSQDALILLYLKLQSVASCIGKP